MWAPNRLYINVQAIEIPIHVNKVPMLLVKQAFTLEPYKNIFNNDESIAKLSIIEAAPIIKIPVPKKKLEAIEIPKYLLKIIFNNVYKLAHPRLIIIFPNIAIIKDPALILNEI